MIIVIHLVALLFCFRCVFWLVGLGCYKSYVIRLKNRLTSFLAAAFSDLCFLVEVVSACSF
jgi:hypothetical protein